MICPNCEAEFPFDQSTFIGHQHLEEAGAYVPLFNCPRCHATRAGDEQPLDHASVLLDAAELFRREGANATGPSEHERLMEIAEAIDARALEVHARCFPVQLDPRAGLTLSIPSIY